MDGQYKNEKINLNSRIKVKLTPHGVDVYYHRFDGLNEHIKTLKGKQIKPDMPQIDKDGFTSMQLWSFMEIFGEHIGMAKENVIDPLYIYTDEAD